MLNWSSLFKSPSHKYLNILKLVSDCKAAQCGVKFDLKFEKYIFAKLEIILKFIIQLGKSNRQ